MTTSIPYTRLASRALMVAALGLPFASMANITLPGGDATLDGAFADMRYGTSGSGTAFVTPRLFISQFGNTLPPFQQVVGTDLGFQYSLEGLGTPNLLLHYVLRNNSSADNFTDLRFIVNVEPSGPGSFLDTVTESWGTKGPFDPDAREIAPYSATPAANLLNRSENNNGVSNGVNACGAPPCDADFALQWNRAALAPGQTWNIDIQLSDSAAIPPTQRFLRAASVDSATTLLTVSAIPEPSEYLLFSAGLAALILRLRKRRVG